MSKLILELQKAIEEPLYDYEALNGKCPYCDFKATTRRGFTMGMANHIRKAHPSKHKNKTDKAYDVFLKYLNHIIGMTRKVYTACSVGKESLPYDILKELERIEETGGVMFDPDTGRLTTEGAQAFLEGLLIALEDLKK